MLGLGSVGRVRRRELLLTGSRRSVLLYFVVERLATRRRRARRYLYQITYELHLVYYGDKLKGCRQGQVSLRARP